MKFQPLHKRIKKDSLSRMVNYINKYSDLGPGLTELGLGNFADERQHIVPQAIVNERLSRDNCVADRCKNPKSQANKLQTRVISC